MQRKKYNVAIIISIILHVFIFSLLFIKLPAKTHAVAQKENVINAVAVQNIPTQQMQPSIQPAKPEPELQPQPQTQPVPAAKIKTLEQKTLALKADPPPKPEPEPVTEEKLEEPQPLTKTELAKLNAQKLAEQKKKEQEKKKVAERKRHERAVKDLQQELTKEQQNLLKQEEENDEEVDEDEIKTVTNPVKEQIAAEQDRLLVGKEIADDEDIIDKFSEKIIRAISNKWLIPKMDDPNLSCKLLVNLGPGGVVISVEVVKESGDAILDQSAQAAIMKASPLPVPDESELFDKFRSLRLTFRPQGIISG